MYYSRKNFARPDLQPKLHRSFDGEIDYLDKYFDGTLFKSPSGTQVPASYIGVIMVIGSGTKVNLDHGFGTRRLGCTGCGTRISVVVGSVSILPIPESNAYCLGSMKSDRWYLYTSSLPQAVSTYPVRIFQI